MEEVFIKVGDSGVDETTLTSSSSHTRPDTVESVQLSDNVTKAVGKHLWVHMYVCACVRA